MNWIQRHRLRRYLNDSIWIGPCVGMIAGMFTPRLLHLIDRTYGWRMSFEPDAARTVLITLGSSMFTFVVFVSSALLIAVQLASAQLTPRIISLVFRDRITRSAMTLFVFTFALSVAAVVRIGSWVPTLTLYTAAYSCVISLALFLYLIDHIGKILRPAKALRTVALLGREVIESVYPHVLEAHGGHDANGHPAIEPGAGPDRRCQTVVSIKDGVTLACDIRGIADLARRAQCVVELVPQVGDFVAKGDPLFRVYGGDGAGGPSAHALRVMIAIGQERSLEQDPRFAFRIIVDIASKALSPAINDPTTAVLAIDQLQHLLGLVGRRHLDDERVRDPAGPIRLLYRTPGWEDFVRLAVTEIRQFGAESIQVNRRLNAMLKSLLRTLPAERAPALRRELELLNRSSIRSFPEPEDQVLAMNGDCQGMGGGQENGEDQENRTPERGRAIRTVPTADAPS